LEKQWIAFQLERGNWDNYKMLMKSVTLIAVLLFQAVLPLHSQPKVESVSPVWRLQDGRYLKFKENQLAAIFEEGKKPLEGKFEGDPFSERIKKYFIQWDNGQTYDLEIAPDGSALRGKNKTGDAITGDRVKELSVQMWCYDFGTVWVNGNPAMSGKYPNVESGRIFVRSGDVVTAEVSNKGGVLEFGFEAFNGNKPTLSAKDFSYSKAPDPDWKTNPNMFGFRSPLEKMKREFPLGSVANPIFATPQKEDEGFKKIHFKCVIR
jgi:hypothetical protein